MKMDLTRHLVIVGPSGSGKSTRGKEVAERLEQPFYDVDTKLNEHFGKKPPEVFADPNIGEAGFRKEETIFLRMGVMSAVPQVIVPGAGAIESEVNRKIMREGGSVLWLDVSPRVLIGRLRDKKDRPLVLDASGKFNEQAVIDRHHKRWPFYKEIADFYVPVVAEMEKSDVLKLILKELSLE